MKKSRSFWRKQHKWFGLALCFFLLMFSVSGIILNHRVFYSKVNVSRAVLPPYYKYENWNAGLLRGTLRLDSTSTLIYGYSGLWLHKKATVLALASVASRRAVGEPTVGSRRESQSVADSQRPVLGDSVADFNNGLPTYADYRIIRNVIQLPDSTLFAVGQYGLYRRSIAKGEWKNIPNEQADRRERFTDIAVHGDSLVLLSRDNLYLSLPPYNTFKRVPLAAPDNYDGRVSLFRVFWLLHNGEMFGFPGRMALDIFALAMILLSLTGFLFWLCPKILKKKRPVLGDSIAESLRRFIKTNYRWHKKVGVWTFFILMFVVVTGWCLRPPLLIPLTLNKMPGIPHTAISPDEPWKDKLRAIRYDEAQGDWLLSTSEGFFSLEESLQGQPKAINGAPHVSVMGINVFQKDSDGHWLVGSLSGMWRWNRASNKVTDYFTAAPMPEKAGSPFGKTPVSGFSADFGTPVIAEYYKGATVPSKEATVASGSAAGQASVPSDSIAGFPSQPEELKTLPMSLWQLALEVHTGRLYNLFGLAPLIWIFLIGLAAIWVLISGWKLRRPS